METKEEKTEMVKLECLKIAKDLGRIEVTIQMDEDKYLSALFSRQYFVKFITNPLKTNKLIDKV